MRIRILGGIGTIALAASAPAAQSDNLMGTTLAVMQGTCSLLLVGGDDLTRQCSPSVINSAYRTGRSSFMFGYGGDKVVSFFGQDSVAVGDQATLQVDEIGVATGKEDGTAKRVPHAVHGTCTYTNPYKGASRITCRASGAGGNYAVDFVSDGQPPNVTRL